MIERGSSATDAVLEARGLNLWYGASHALKNIDIEVARGEVTAIIGPSGCGKSSLLRCFNRMNDLIPGVRVEGEIRLDGWDVYRDGLDATEVRLRTGMVFQKPNPFPKSIYDNVAFGPRVNGVGGNIDELVESALRHAALWGEVKDRLKENATVLSGGQQQRLCIARALAVKPEVLLMDEPCSALDPASTQRIEDLITNLRDEVTVVIVTHNMQQAARVSQKSAFMLAAEAGRPGELIEFSDTATLFSRPADRRTEDYITGRFG